MKSSTMVTHPPCTNHNTHCLILSEKKTPAIHITLKAGFHSKAVKVIYIPVLLHIPLPV